ncbi:MAG: hypothetical protein AB7G11_08725 [Phycisphaerales bacterium]
MAFTLSKVRSVSLLTNSTSPIAIDFGIGSLKVLQIGVGDEYSLIAAAQAEVPDDVQTDHVKRLDFQAEALARIIRGGAFKGKRAMCAIPASQVFCRHLQFAKSESDIAGAVRSAIPATLGCHPDALVYRHSVVGGVTGAVPSTKQEVISFAVPLELIRRVMDALRGCKLEPVGIHPSTLATMRGFDVLCRREEDKNTVSAYIDLGAGATTCIMAHGKEMVFAKTINIGGRHLDEAAAAQLRCGVTWARTQRREAIEIVPARTPESSPPASSAFDDATGESDLAVAPSAAPPTSATSSNGVHADAKPTGKQIRLDLSSQLECLADEIWMCLRYHADLFPEKRLSRLILVGGESRNALLVSRLASRLDIEVQVADPMALVAKHGTEVARDVDVKQPLPGWTTTLGLCLCPADL